MAIEHGFTSSESTTETQSTKIWQLQRFIVANSWGSLGKVIHREKGIYVNISNHLQIIYWHIINSSCASPIESIFLWCVFEFHVEGLVFFGQSPVANPKAPAGNVVRCHPSFCHLRSGNTLEIYDCNKQFQGYINTMCYMSNVTRMGKVCLT